MLGVGEFSGEGVAVEFSVEDEEVGSFFDEFDGASPGGALSG